jgi:hypothetical protein
VPKLKKMTLPSPLSASGAANARPAYGEGALGMATRRTLRLRARQAARAVLGVLERARRGLGTGATDVKPPRHRL